MEWYYYLLIAVLVIGGILCVTVLCLHIFECTYIYRRKRNSELGNDFTFAVDLNASSGSSGPLVSSVPLHSRALPPSSSVVVPAASSPTTTLSFGSPSTTLTFSDGNASSAFPSPTFHLPASPEPARTRTRTRTTSASTKFDRLRGKEVDPDLERQDDYADLEFSKIGW